LRQYNAAFSGGRLAYFIMGSDQYQVVAQVEHANRTEPSDISRFIVRNVSGENTSFKRMVHLVESSNPTTLYHYNRYKAATISASLGEGETIGDGVEAMQAIANKTLDESFQTAIKRSIERLCGKLFQYWFCIYTGIAVDLFNSCRTVRELPRSFHYNVHRSAGIGRRLVKLYGYSDKH
jgi:multidrug efflux pump subunit AcrB